MDPNKKGKGVTPGTGNQNPNAPSSSSSAAPQGPAPGSVPGTSIFAKAAAQSNATLQQQQQQQGLAAIQAKLRMMTVPQRQQYLQLLARKGFQIGSQGINLKGGPQNLQQGGVAPGGKLGVAPGTTKGVNLPGGSSMSMDPQARIQAQYQAQQQLINQQQQQQHVNLNQINAGMQLNLPGGSKNLLQQQLLQQQLLGGHNLRTQQLMNNKSSYKKLYEAGQELHENPKDEWKVLDPRVSRAVPSQYDKWRIVGSFIESRGLISCQLDNFNSFVERGIHDIVMHKSNVEIRCDVDRDWYIRYDSVKIGKPQMTDDKSLQDLDLYPQECRLRDMTYCAPIYVKYHYYCGKKAKQQHCSPFGSSSGVDSGGGIGGSSHCGSPGLCIGKLPIMLRSKYCHLYGLSDEEMMAKGSFSFGL